MLFIAQFKIVYCLFSKYFNLIVDIYQTL